MALMPSQAAAYTDAQVTAQYRDHLDTIRSQALGFVQLTKSDPIVISTIELCHN